MLYHTTPNYFWRKYQSPRRIKQIYWTFSTMNGSETKRDARKRLGVNYIGRWAWLSLCVSLLSSFSFSSEKCGQVFHESAKIQFIDKRESCYRHWQYTIPRKTHTHEHISRNIQHTSSHMTFARVVWIFEWMVKKQLDLKGQSWKKKILFSFMMMIWRMDFLFLCNWNKLASWKKNST